MDFSYLSSVNQILVSVGVLVNGEMKYQDQDFLRKYRNVKVVFISGNCIAWKKVNASQDVTETFINQGQDAYKKSYICRVIIFFWVFNIFDLNLVD